MWMKNMAKHMFVWRMTRQIASIFEASIAPWPAECDAGKTCERICNNIFGYWQTRWGSFLFKSNHREIGVFRTSLPAMCYNINNMIDMIPLFFMISIGSMITIISSQITTVIPPQLILPSFPRPGLLRCVQLVRPCFGPPCRPGGP